MLTQLVRYGRMLDVELSSAKCRVRAHWTSEGSVLAGTISSTCHSIEIETEIESPNDPALVAALIQNAEGGCYAQSVIQNPTPVSATVRLNGEPLEYEDYPAKPERGR
jgi:hypothetical protein